ncbi:MAG: hypothetical protein ACI8YO_002676, partial [Gammaproteobacteria bacterium]
QFKNKKYDEADWQVFTSYIETIMSSFEKEPEAREKLIKKYAFPVINAGLVVTSTDVIV